MTALIDVCGLGEIAGVSRAANSCWCSAPGPVRGDPDATDSADRHQGKRQVASSPL